MSHVPVLLDAVLQTTNVLPGQVVIDGTFGAGGYSRAFLERGARVYAFDRDPTAIAGGASLQEEFGNSLTLIEAPFDRLEEELMVRPVAAVDAIVFDFGVSSMQLDQAERGFSFRFEGPLDMRMGAGRPVSDFVNEADETDLANVIFQYGEERRSRALAKAIVEERRSAPIRTTDALAQIAEKVLGAKGPIHPATRMFQGLRIFINDELGQIVRALVAAEKMLREGGRLVAVSFHSLEDRIVKRFLTDVTGRAGGGSRHAPVVEAPTPTFSLAGKDVAATEDEVARNPRARSARLRGAIRTQAPARPWSSDRLSALGLPPMVFSSLQQEWVKC